MHPRTFWSVFLLVFFAIALGGAAPAAAATSCENLASLSLPNAKINSAQMVAAGTFVSPGGGGRAGRGEGTNPFAKLPAFCRVTATLTPTSDSDIKTEIWLPATGWNGKYEAVGNGGWAGIIPYPGIAVNKLESGALFPSLHHRKEGWPSDQEDFAKHPPIARPGWFSD